MQPIEITADGTYPFFLQAGLYRLDIEGTKDSGLAVALNAGASADGSGHVAVPDQFGTAVVFSGSTPIVPPLLQGSGYYSLVVTGYGSSSGLKATLRKSDVS